MKSHAYPAALTAMLLCAGLVHGHGIPIGVTVVNNKLTISQGVVDPIGFAPMMIINGDDDGQLDHVFVPNFGTVALTRLPGFDISGMAIDSGLYLNIIPRPVKDSSPSQSRLLWHWNAAMGKVMVDPKGESLVVASEFGQVTAPQAALPVPAPLKVANPNSEDMGQHEHFLRYLLGDSPPAATGAFGFFAQLSSPSYATSDPMLVIFNNGLNPDQILIAGLAINAAAVAPSSLLGDYNHNGVVDAADYNVWRDTLGSTTMLAADGSGNSLVDTNDYNIWRNNFGHSGSGSAADIKIGQPVAEPNGVGLALCASLGVLAKLATCRRRRATVRL